MARDPIKQQAARRRHYEKNKVAIKAKARVRTNAVRKEIRLWLHQHLKNNHCVDCGETDPIVLEFDHVRGKKTFNIGNVAVGGYSLKRVQDEVAKCEVRCANCHRRKTYREAGLTHRG